MKVTTFRYLAWALLALCMFVIVWGAFVRVSGSGAGCGSSWPLCNGQVVPLSPGEKTTIEYFHRVTSGLALLASVLLFFLGRMGFSPQHRARRASGFALVFMITEALIGAALVLFGLVEHDTSGARAVVIGAHLINSFLLLAAVALSAWWARSDLPERQLKLGPVPWAAAAGLLGLLLVGATGAIAALGDTLFPSASLAEGLEQDFAYTAHMLIRLRSIHPIAAVGTSCYVLAFAYMVLSDTKELRAACVARLLITTVLFQVGLGFLNLLLLAPNWLQLAHLFTAGLTWVLLVFCADSASFVPVLRYRVTAEACNEEQKEEGRKVVGQ